MDKEKEETSEILGTKKEGVEEGSEKAVNTKSKLNLSFKFHEPEKKVVNAPDMPKWLSSDAFKKLQGWLRSLNESTKSKSNHVSITLSENVQNAINFIDKVRELVDSTPPLPGQMRYGNKAFKDFHDKLCDQVVNLHKPFGLPESANKELSGYIKDSFGNKTRIDYGTGHELHFVIWMYCLHAVGVFEPSDFTALVTKVFSKYLDLIRHIQQTYGQEPAGSRGVWCLDDYQFIPFIWGSAQLIDNPDGIMPSTILNQTMVSKFADKYLYLGCIQYINQVKKGPFFEHSPDLFNISGAASWQKINTGMFMKYNDDVLVKFPVIQHLLFGSIYSYT